MTNQSEHSESPDRDKAAAPEDFVSCASIESKEVGETESPVSDEIEVLVLDENAPVHYYSPQSDIREPVRLVSNMFRDFLAGRELAWRLFVRNLRGMYRQTLLGLFWAFLPPIANTAIWIFLKSQNAFSTSGLAVPDAVFILTGMILWQAFVDAFQAPARLVKSNKNMVSRLNFPRESLLLVGFGEVTFNLMIRLLLLVPAFWYYGIAVHPGILLSPIAIASMIFFGLGLGLLILPIGSLYQDVERFVGMFVPFWMIITPIIYNPPSFDSAGPFAYLLNWLNPAAPLLILSRDLLLLGGTEHVLISIIFVIISLPVFFLGLVFYRISLPVLIERMAT